MAPNDILRKLRRNPFQPLRVHMSDGASYDISESYFATINVTELHIGVEPDETGLPRRTIYCDARHVTRIEPLPTSPSSNGR